MVSQKIHKPNVDEDFVFFFYLQIIFIFLKISLWK